MDLIRCKFLRKLVLLWRSNASVSFYEIKNPNELFATKCFSLYFFPPSSRYSRKLSGRFKSKLRLSLVAICKSRVVSKMSIKWNLKKSFQVWTHKVARETRRPNEWMVLPFLNIYKVMSISNNYIPITVTAVAVSGVLGHSAFLPCNTSNTVTNSDRIVLVLWYKDGIETPIYRFVWFDFLLVTRDIFHKLSSLFFFALIISSITIYEGN